MKTLDLASDVISGSATFAGLIIVYVGAVATAYGSYGKPEQRAVRARFRRRAILGSVGVVTGALAAGMALVGEWMASKGMVGASAILMLITLVCGVGVAVQTVREID